MQTSKKHFKKLTKDSSLRIERKNVKKEVKALLKYGHSVQVISKGQYSLIKCNGVKLIDYNAIEKQFNFHIWRQVNEAVYKSIGSHVPVRYDTVRPHSHKKEVKIGDRIVYVDINHCYLQIANKLGYVLDVDYRRLLREYSTTKIQVCAAITSLYREVKSDYFNDKGRIYRTVLCENGFLEEAQNNIINYSRKIMLDYCDAGMDYYYRNVDGIVVPASDKSLIVGYMKNMELEYKIIEGRYLGNGMVFNEKTKKLEDCL